MKEKRKKAATLARSVRGLGKRIRGCPDPLVHRQHGAAEQAVKMFGDVERVRYLVELRRERYAQAVEQIEAFRKAVEAWESTKPAVRPSGYTNRADYAETGEQCDLSETCQLHGDHGGDCDARPERERWANLFARLDAEEAEGRRARRRARQRRAAAPTT